MLSVLRLHVVNYDQNAGLVKPREDATFLAPEIIELEKSKLDGLSAHFGVPYRFYVGTKTDFFDSIEQNGAFDSLGEDLGFRWTGLTTMHQRIRTYPPSCLGTKAYLKGA